MRYLFCLFLLLIVVKNNECIAQQSILKKKIDFNQQEERLEEILLSLADEGGFSFSYNPSLLPVDSLITIQHRDTSVKTILTDLLGSELDYRVTNNMLVILKTKFSPNPISSKSSGKKTYTIDGFLRNAENGELLPSTTVYDIGGLRSTTTDNQGYFSLEIPVKEPVIAIGVEGEDLENTAIVVVNKDQNLNIPVLPSKGVEGQGGKGGGGVKMVNSNKIVRLIASEDDLKRSQNQRLSNYRTAQVSFLPFVGTNLKMSGSVENRFSFNILAGYNGATSGFEFGGLFNTTRYHTKGVQLAGLGNIVGQETNGVQFAGLFNSNLGSVKGLQLAGLSNVVFDSLRGLQFAGLSNFSKSNVDGWQLSGVINVALKDVNKAQIAGVLNFGRNINGGQFAGVLNTSYGKVGGFQFAGVLNSAKNVGVLQIAGVMNVAIDTVNGVQVASVFNYATHNKGFQLGLVNMGHSSKGLSIGLLNLFWKGYNKLEIHSNQVLPFSVRVKLGNKKFYNIFGIGTTKFSPRQVWGYTYGFGSRFALGKKGNEINIDITATDLQDDDSWFEDIVINSRTGVYYGQKINRRMMLFGGPTWNYLIYEDKPEPGFASTVAPRKMIETRRGSWIIEGWVGFEVGLRLL